MKRYLSLIVLIAFFAFGAAYIYGGPGAIVSKETVSTSVLTQMDQPVFLSLKEMTDNSDLVVLGSYTGKYVEYDDVQIYDAIVNSSEKIMVHFEYGSINVPDDTISTDGKLPQTGETPIIVLAIAIVAANAGAAVAFLRKKSNLK